MAGGRGVLSYVDDEGASGSYYGEYVARCPCCGGQRLVVEEKFPSVTVPPTARELAEALNIPAEAARALVSSAAT